MPASFSSVLTCCMCYPGRSLPMLGSLPKAAACWVLMMSMVGEGGGVMRFTDQPPAECTAGAPTL
jgi:hypothetical protein